MKTIVSSDHIFQFKEIASDPVLADLPTGTNAVFRNISTGNLEHWGNNEGVIELISGGGAGGDLDATLTLGNSSDLSIIYDAPASLLATTINYVTRELIPSEHGVNAAVAKWYETFGEYQAGQEGSPTARKNVVWSFGYNIQQDIANEGYMRFGMESNYRPGGGDELFEWHAPEVLTRDGNTNRWYSIYGSKNTALNSVAHYFSGDVFSFRKTNNTSNELFGHDGSNWNTKANLIRFKSKVYDDEVRVTIQTDTIDTYLTLTAGSGGNNYINSAANLYTTAPNILLTASGANIISTGGFYTTPTTAYKLALNLSTSGVDGARILSSSNNTGGIIEVRAESGGSVAPVLTVFNNASTLKLFTVNADGKVGININTPEASSIFDITSTTKGFLPPRMTTTQRDNITSPVAGLMIYNTSTNKLNVYTTAWEAVTSI